MKSLHDVIAKSQFFVGRDKELSLMRQQLHHNHKDDWSIIHFYGTAGMGKTVLLKQFAAIQSHLPHIYIHHHKGFSSQEDFLHAIHEQLLNENLLLPISSELNIKEELYQAARKHDHFIILLDGIDEWSDLHDWLKEDFLRQLPINVRIYSAGRRPLDCWQTEFGWETIVKNLKLDPFRSNEWTLLANSHGITDHRLIYQIGFISQGIPLAVSMTCHWIRKYGMVNNLFGAESRFLMASFNKYLLSERNLDGVCHTLLSLASLPYTFDQGLLEYMLDEQIDPIEFDRLCQSSFVEIHVNGGWTVKNGIRWLARASIRNRFPDLYEQYKQRAEELLEKRMSSSNKTIDKLELAIGKSFLQENLYTHNLLYFGGQQQLNHRSARKDDLAMLAKMYQDNIQLAPPHVVDDTHQEQYFIDIWKVAPDAIQMIELDGQCVSFHVSTALTDEIQAILRNNPVTQHWAQATTLNDDDWFIGFNSASPPIDWETVNYFLYQHFLSILTNRRVFCLLQMDDDAFFLQLLGFKHLKFADFKSANGLTFSIYYADFRETKNTTATTKVQAITHSSSDEIDDWVTLTKELLANLSFLPYQSSLLDQCNRLWNSELEYVTIAEQIVVLIQQHYQRLQEGTRQEKIQAKILHYAYLKRSGSHEVVAELLNLPSSTYYRQLKKLIHSIALILKSQILFTPDQ